MISNGSSDKLTCAKETACVSVQCEHDCRFVISPSRADRLPSPSGGNVLLNETKQCVDTAARDTTIHSQDTDRATASVSFTNVVNGTGLQQSHGRIETLGIEIVGSEPLPTAPIMFQTNQIPVPLQDDDAASAQQVFPTLNGAAQIQDSGRNLPKENSCQEKYVSVGVQCSLDPVCLSSSSSSSSERPLTSKDKWTQMYYVPKCTHTAVQTDSNETGRLRCTVDSCSTTAALCSAGKVMQKADNEVFALKKELDSMQNTVIWQALMLRLYRM